MARKFRKLSVATSGALTFGATGSESGTLSPIVHGRALALYIVHPADDAGYSLTITDVNGFDVLDGLGTVGAGGLSLFAGDIGGKPCYGELTYNITGATNTDTTTIYLYIDSVPADMRAFA